MPWLSDGHRPGQKESLVRMRKLLINPTFAAGILPRASVGDFAGGGETIDTSSTTFATTSESETEEQLQEDFGTGAGTLPHPDTDVLIATSVTTDIRSTTAGTEDETASEGCDTTEGGGTSFTFTFSGANVGEDTNDGNPCK